MLTLPQLVQLYAPLVGLLVLAFHAGTLSQRVKFLEAAKEKTGGLEREQIEAKVILGGLVTEVKDLRKEMSWLTTVPQKSQPRSACAASLEPRRE